MIIAIPTENGAVFQHFGKSQLFTIAEVENNTVKSKKEVDTSNHGHEALATFLNGLQVDTVICGGIGQGARNALSGFGISVIGGVQGTLEKALADFCMGILQDNPNTGCGHHDHAHEAHSCGERCHVFYDTAHEIPE